MAMRTSNRAGTSRMNISFRATLLLPALLTLGGGSQLAPAVQQDTHAVVASYYPIAAKIGIEVLRDGGNATDAFIATVLAEYVLAPGVTTLAGNFGALVYDASNGKVSHLDGEYNNVSAVDGRFHAGDPSGKTVVVFGSVAALFELAKHSGSRPFSELAQPAIRLAEDGFLIDATFSTMIQWRRAQLERTEYGRTTYLPDGKPLQVGVRLQLPEVAVFLRKLAEQGADYMYKGDWAQRCVQEVRSQGGLLTLKDLAAYRPQWHTPTRIEYRGYEIVGPSGRFYGGIAVQLALKILEHGNLGEIHYSTKSDDFALLVSVMRTALSELWLYDPKRLDDSKFIQQQLRAKSTEKLFHNAAKFVETEPTKSEGSHSTSLVVVDSAGNIIVATHSINALAWGEGIFVQGVALTAGGQWPNVTGPGERRTTPLSHHIVFKNGRPWFATSAWNGSLIEAEFQFLVNAIDYGLDVDRIASMPRFGTYPYAVVDFSRDYSSNLVDPRVEQQLLRELANRGLKFVQSKSADTGLGTMVRFGKDGIPRAQNASVGGAPAPGAVENL